MKRSISFECKCHVLILCICHVEVVKQRIIMCASIDQRIYTYISSVSGSVSLIEPGSNWMNYYVCWKICVECIYTHVGRSAWCWMYRFTCWQMAVECICTHIDRLVLMLSALTHVDRMVLSDNSQADRLLCVHTLTDWCSVHKHTCWQNNVLCIDTHADRLVLNVNTLIDSLVLCVSTQVDGLVIKSSFSLIWFD